MNRCASLRPGWLLEGGRKHSSAESWRGPAKGNLGQTVEASYFIATHVMPDLPTAADPILTRLAAGEPRAMNVCIDSFGGLVWSIVRRSVGNATEAEDLVQEIFTEIWKKAGYYDPQAAPEATFIALVARRRTIDHLRRNGRRPEHEPLDAATSLPAHVPPVPAPGCDPEAVRSSVAALPEDTRELFRMHFDEGFTHPEIAEKTGLPLGTVKTRLRRGLITLREHLQGSGATHIQPAS